MVMAAAGEAIAAALGELRHLAGKPAATAREKFLDIGRGLG